MQSPHAAAVVLPPVCTQADLERVTEIFFHRLHVPELFIANPWMMTLMANGSLTGLIVHSSDTALCIAPIANVKLVEEGLIVMPLAAAELLVEQGQEALVEVSRALTRMHSANRNLHLLNITFSTC